MKRDGIYTNILYYKYIIIHYMSKLLKDYVLCMLIFNVHLFLISNFYIKIVKINFKNIDLYIINKLSTTLF